MTSIVCRVCLDGNVKMHSIQDHKLLEIYEKLSDSKLNAGDGLPTAMCYICFSQLQRCRRFSDMASKSTKTLTHLLHSNLKISYNNVTHQGVTRQLTLTAVSHTEMTVEDNSVEDCQIIVMQEQVLVNIEPVEYEEPLDISESRLDDFGVSSSQVEGETPQLAATTVSHKTERQHSVGDCTVNIKEEPINDKDPLETERLDVVDADISQDMKKPRLQESHQDNINKTYACTLCSKTFNKSGNLKQHNAISFWRKTSCL